MFVSVTRLRVRSVLLLPVFLYRSHQCVRQAVVAKGFRGGVTLIDKGRVFWTLTQWDSERSMKAYRGAQPHAAVMPKIVDWCSEAAVTHFEHEGETLPSWREAWQRLTQTPRFIALNHPNDGHQARRIAEPDQDEWRTRTMK